MFINVILSVQVYWCGLLLECNFFGARQCKKSWTERYAYYTYVCV